MPDVAVDIGNSRMKWGRCTRDGIGATASLPAGAAPVWDAQPVGHSRSQPLGQLMNTTLIDPAVCGCGIAIVSELTAVCELA